MVKRVWKFRRVNGDFIMRNENDDIEFLLSIYKSNGGCYHKFAPPSCKDCVIHQKYPTLISGTQCVQIHAFVVSKELLENNYIHNSKVKEFFMEELL